MVQGQVFFKGGGHFSHLIFSRFDIFTFTNYFTLCKIVLPVCTVDLIKKNDFFLPA